jgi:hypothetical protein
MECSNLGLHTVLWFCYNVSSLRTVFHHQEMRRPGEKRVDIKLEENGASVDAKGF